MRLIDRSELKDQSANDTRLAIGEKSLLISNSGEKAKVGLKDARRVEEVEGAFRRFNEELKMCKGKEEAKGPEGKQ